MVGQNILGQSTEKRAQEDHDNIMAELAEIKAMHLELTALHKDKSECAYSSQ
jgi:hypothetical protein